MKQEVYYSDGNGNIIRSEVVDDMEAFEAYIREHPNTTAKEVSRALCIGKNTVTRRANRIGIVVEKTGNLNKIHPKVQYRVGDEGVD